MFRLYECNFSSTIELVTGALLVLTILAVSFHGASSRTRATFSFASLVTALVGRREIALTRPHGHPRLRHPHFELVHLVVQRDRRKPNQVLTAQLLRHARERRREVRGLQQLEVAAAGFVRNLAQVARRPRRTTRMPLKYSDSRPIE